jgi:hypothetical protein
MVNSSPIPTPFSPDMSMSVTRWLRLLEEHVLDQVRVLHHRSWLLASFSCGHTWGGDADRECWPFPKNCDCGTVASDAYVHSALYGYWASIQRERQRGILALARCSSGNQTDRKQPLAASDESPNSYSCAQLHRSVQFFGSSEIGELRLGFMQWLGILTLTSNCLHNNNIYYQN